MDTFRNKLVPKNINLDRPLETQDEYCNNTECDNEDLDCGDCIFDSRFCKVEIFNDWVKWRKENGEDRDSN